MNDTTLTCPKCGAAVPLTEALAAPMVEAVRAEYEAKIRRQDLASLAIQEDVRKRNAELDATIAAQVRAKEEELRVQAAAQAQGAITAAEQRTKDLETKLVEAQTAQAEALCKERALAERERELDLVIERRLSDETVAIRARVQNEAETTWSLKVAEREATIAGMQTKLAEAQRKAEQGSQQLQGEVQETDLEATLRARFPFDQIGEVAKGVTGADVTQKVIAPSGAECGVILWESKRTKNWSAGWLPKLREDGRKAGADLLVIVSSAVPQDITGFDQMDGVWVAEPRYALPLAALLREALLRAHAVRQAEAGQATKAELVYKYLTGPAFRHRVEALVEAFTTMTEDLVAERRAVTKAWAKREAQLDKVLASTTGLFGDLQGIAGAAIPEIEGMAMAALGGGE